ncbi:hypothetical protein BaRGS_00018845 [Batillaria attramentaria]|uniref:PA domain-containing protein n=1 Tax=Batillaria attramentaria TaxID=370345 RepID=A0ABD0KS86_9CAEN
MKSKSLLIDVIAGLMVFSLLAPIASPLPKKPVHAMIAVSIMDSDTSSGALGNITYYHGLYGQRSLHTPVSGHLVHVRSKGNVNNGCSDYDHDLPTHDWVALIERGTCYFSEKVRVATRQYNASAVIIYDNQPSTHLVSMQSYVTDQVYVFVVQSTGRKLALLTDRDPAVHVHVNITALDLNAGSAASQPAGAFLLPYLAANVAVVLFVGVAIG